MHDIIQPDYGTSQKKLGIYIIGFIGCSVLTLIAFFSVMMHVLPKWQTFILIYTAACIQFFIQVICFLRLNTETEQGRINVMSFIFTILILLCIVFGSLWIMWNLHYNLM